MSTFRANLQKQPVKTPRRLWIEAIVIGIASEGILAGALMLLGNPTAFGPLRGAVASIAPIGVFVVAEIIRDLLGGTGGAGIVGTIVIGIAVSLMIAFAAFLAGAIRTRYRPRPPA